ncbi:MAG: trypsin-like peptidase domain-containing protein, partial [Bradyrhizobium sp.]
NNKGHVITNRHVIEGSSRAEVKTSEGKVYPVKEVLGEDKEGDIILLSVAIPQKKVRPISISALLPEVGEQVVVIGNPLGLEQTVNRGAAQRRPTCCGTPFFNGTCALSGIRTGSSP